MRKLLTFSAILLVSVLLSSCAAVAGIFKAGVWVGVLLVGVVVGVIIFLISRSGK